MSALNRIFKAFFLFLEYLNPFIIDKHFDHLHGYTLYSHGAFKLIKIINHYTFLLKYVPNNNCFKSKQRIPLNYLY
jgi:hypothetical protein